MKCNKYFTHSSCSSANLVHRFSKFKKQKMLSSCWLGRELFRSRSSEYLHTVKQMCYFLLYNKTEELAGGAKKKKPTEWQTGSIRKRRAPICSRPPSLSPTLISSFTPLSLCPLPKARRKPNMEMIKPRFVH